MANRRALDLVYAAGVAQGMALVTFPATSTILTSPTAYGLSGTAYGLVFAPQVVCAIGASLLAAELTSRVGPKRICRWGLLADAVSMALLWGSSFALRDPGLAYVMLLLATGCLGIGFGLTVPALNTIVATLSAHDPDRGVLNLNALLGLGTVLAPALIAVFVGLHVWYGLPLLVGAFAATLLVLTRSVALGADARSPASSASHAPLPRRFWLYATAALLYGVVETMNGNWAELVMTQDVAASAAIASITLTTFWAAVTGGRLAFGALERRLPPHLTYRLLPFSAALALLLVARLPRGADVSGVLAFGLAGVSCSALLPLTISFAQTELASIRSGVAGALIAFYQAGYGLAAFGAGPARRAAGTSLASVFALTAAVAVVLGVLALSAARSPSERISE